MKFFYYRLCLLILFSKLFVLENETAQLAEKMNDYNNAYFAYENALRHDHFNLTALKQIGSIFREQKLYSKAIEYYHRALTVDKKNIEIWGALGHCHLMMDNLNQAYTSYHQALFFSKQMNKTKQDPNIWFVK